MYTTPRASATLATSDTHAREPRQSALSTCLPLLPSNYQSEGLRCLAARSVSSVPRAMAERESSSNCTPRGTTYYRPINNYSFSPRNVFQFWTSPVHDPSLQLHQTNSWSFEPDRGRSNSPSTWPRRRKYCFYFCVTFGERRNSVFPTGTHKRVRGRECRKKSHVLACRLRAYVAVSLSFITPSRASKPIAKAYYGKKHSQLLFPSFLNALDCVPTDSNAVTVLPSKIRFAKIFW